MKMQLKNESIFRSASFRVHFIVSFTTREYPGALLRFPESPQTKKKKITWVTPFGPKGVSTHAILSLLSLPPPIYLSLITTSFFPLGLFLGGAILCGPVAKQNLDAAFWTRSTTFETPIRLTKEESGESVV